MALYFASLHLNKKMTGCWQHLRDNKSFTIFFDDNDEGLIIYSLSCKNKDGTNEWSYTFQEEGLGYGYHFVCYGNFELNTADEVVISQTLHDKYDDCFTPNFAHIMSVFFDDITHKYECPNPTIID